MQASIARPKRLPRSALPKDTTTKVDKDANCTILTSEMCRKVNELKSENGYRRKKSETEKKKKKKKK